MRHNDRTLIEQVTTHVSRPSARIIVAIILATVGVILLVFIVAHTLETKNELDYDLDEEYLEGLMTTADHLPRKDSDSNRINQVFRDDAGYMRTHG